MPDLNHGLIMRADLSSDGMLRGVASTIGDADLMQRVFLPGAFGRDKVKVPLLLNHDNTPLGESVLTPTPTGLRHESRIVGEPLQPGTGVPIRALLHSGYPATSIGWYDEASFFGWSQFARAEPEWSRQLAAAGLAQDESLRYFLKARIAENSLVSVPANPRALLDAASMLPSNSVERLQLEQAATWVDDRRDTRPYYMGGNSYTPNQAARNMVQEIHDHATQMGATCQDQAAFRWTSPNGMVVNGTNTATTSFINPQVTPYPVTVTNSTNAPEITFDPAATILTETADGKAKYSMPDGSYPISNCSDVSDAAKLARHSKSYSFEQVRRHVMRAKNALNCNDDVLPETWESPGDDESKENSALPARPSDPEPEKAAVAAPTQDFDLGQLEKELSDLTERP